MPNKQTEPVSEQIVAARFIAAVVSEAHYVADLVAAFLKAHGYTPHEPSAAEPRFSDGPLIRQAKGTLLNLGAALRLWQWENAGLRGHLPKTLPSSTDAFRNVVPPKEAEQRVPPLALAVFDTWVREFCRGGRAVLGTDVILKQDSLCEEHLLDALADFLWDHRHLAKREDGEP
jgi:hypothetical protein